MIVLCMVAHPDDEVLGAGGTLAKHVKAGHSVYLDFLTDGGRPRFEAAKQAAQALGAAADPIFHDFPDNQLDTVPMLTLAKRIEDTIHDLVPDTVYTHHLGDLNIDHRRCAEAVLTACRPQPGHPVKRIYGMEVPSSTEWGLSPFHPTHFVDITDTYAVKADALKHYHSEMREDLHPRSYRPIYCLCVWRGATVGVQYAEAFEVLREIA